MRPKRARIIGRSARRVSRKAPVRLVSSTRAQASSSICERQRVVADAGVVHEHEHRAEGAPRAARAARSAVAGSRTSPGSGSAAPPAASISRDHARGAVLVGAVVDADRPAVGGERAGPPPRRCRASAPVTSAQPVGAHAVSPLDRGRAPGEAGAEGGEQHAVARREPAVLGGARQRERDRGRRGVAKPSMQSTTRSAGSSSRSADRAHDPAVGLVVDEQVDVVEPSARGLDAPRACTRPGARRRAEGLVALHLDEAGARGGRGSGRRRSRPARAAPGRCGPAPSVGADAPPRRRRRRTGRRCAGRRGRRSATSGRRRSRARAAPGRPRPGRRRARAPTGSRVQAAPTSNAPAAVAPSASATSGAALGSRSSWLIVATTTRSSSERVELRAAAARRGPPPRPGR